MNTHTLELDLSKDGLGAGLVRVGQGDKHGTTIKALIYDGGASQRAYQPPFVVRTALRLFCADRSERVGLG